MSTSLDSHQKSFIFKLDNTSGNKMVAIKISAFSRDQDHKTAKDILNKTNDIQVFPSHVIIPAGQIRPVRIVVSNNLNNHSEKAYRLVAEAVQAKNGKIDNSGIQILFKYIASIYIQPETQQKDSKKLIINSVKLKDKSLLLDISNPNSTHKIMLINEIIVDSGIAINGYHALQNVLSKSRVVLEIPLDKSHANILRNAKTITFVNNCKMCSAEDKHLATLN